MTTFLRTRRFRGGVRHDFNLRDVKEEGVKLAKTQLSGDLKICRDQSLNPPVAFRHPIINADCTRFRTGNGAR